jgi:hypothetical protein
MPQRLPRVTYRGVAFLATSPPIITVTFKTTTPNWWPGSNVFGGKRITRTRWWRRNVTGTG